MKFGCCVTRFSNSTIKHKPATSILKLQIGDAIKLSQPDFVRLFKGFFAEIEARFV